jgi:hypothetical protein
MSFIFGGGSSAPTTTGQSTVTQREAPGVEARKLSLYDEAARLAAQPAFGTAGIPALQVAPISSIEQAAITQAGQTGVGAGTVGSGISSLQASQAAPNISQFLNPYQSFVTDEIARRGQMQQNQIAANAVASGAFGGGREGVQQAELQRATQANIGQSLAQGFQTALGAAQNQQRTQLGVGQALGQLGAQQQAMSLADIQAQLQAGALQRGIGQAQLDAQRSTALQREYEPYQRLEFLKGIMTNLPTTQSTLTATTAPGANPLAQAAGTALGGYAAYNMMQPR